MSEIEITMGSNTLDAQVSIFHKGDPVTMVALIIRGHVEITGNGVRMTAGAGNFLGMVDAGHGVHSFQYTTTEETTLFALPIQTMEDVYSLLDSNSQYRGLLVTSTNLYFKEISGIFAELKKHTLSLKKLLTESYTYYQKTCVEMGHIADHLSALDSPDPSEDSSPVLSPDVLYFVECGRIPEETQKQFYAGSAYVSKDTFTKQCAALATLLAGCESFTQDLCRLSRILFQNEKSMFSLLGHLAYQIRESGEDFSPVKEKLDLLLSQIQATNTLLTKRAGTPQPVTPGRIREIYRLLQDGTEAGDTDDSDHSIELLINSLDQILDYAPITPELRREFYECIQEFIRTSDRFSKEPAVRALRKRISDKFFPLYEAVVKKNFSDANPPLAVRLFLRYGYVSEHLLTEKEQMALISLPDPFSGKTTCQVYTMEQWLKEIYLGHKNPSKDEFNEDYEDHLRKDLRSNRLTEQQYKMALSNADERLHFEIYNFMMYTDRILNGNITSFVPVLCSDAINTDLAKSYVTPSSINRCVSQVEQIDYSIFYRDHRVSFEEVGVTSFSVVERMTPDFIVFPVYGRQGLVWQDIEGRRKNTHGRILLPSFLEIQMDSAIRGLLASFRWEKCRTEMGSQWNNVRYPSLTSEYSDYLQFYRKNGDLTPERKEKLKTQLQQCNNRFKDVFMRDYNDWITRESSGSGKLNRVARQILFTYCPFSKEICDKIGEQPAYVEASKRYRIAHAKELKTISTTLHRFEKNGLEFPSELMNTKNLISEEF